MNREVYTTGTGQRLLVHRERDCAPPCPIHSPSDHPLAEARTHWRGDRVLMERVCPHGIGHPDPDDLARKSALLGEDASIEEYGVHGCDGCCSVVNTLNATPAREESMTLNEMRDRAYANAVNKGFHDSEVTRLVPVKLALVHTEVSEAIEADRKGDDENFGEEIADIFIRLGDLCGMKGIDIESIVASKMAYNESRPYLHGNKRY